MIGLSYLAATRSSTPTAQPQPANDQPPPMRETWLQPNRRALWFGCVPPFIVAMIGAWLATSTYGSGSAWQWLGIAIAIAASVVLVALLRHITCPRVAYRDGNVLFNLRSGPPIAVPVDVVEAFFIGQGPAHLPGHAQETTKTRNLVARLSQRETDWAQRVVKPQLGAWCEGYVTIRGTWCEPLTPEIVRHLNRRLKEVKTLAEQTPADVATT